MSGEARYFWAGVVCTVVAIVLTWAFADRIFGSQRTTFENQVISVEILEPNFSVEVIP